VSSQTTDVVVVGAGPAGTAAAITLSRLGRRVTVVDRAEFPRDKCCGDGLTAAALRRAEHLGLDPDLVASWQPVHEVEVVAPSGRRVSLPFDSDGGGWFAVSARREDLDAAMVETARRSGAEVIEGCAVGSVSSVDNSGVVVDLENGRRLGARYVLACDGMWSPVRRSLGLTPPGYLGEWQAGRQYMRNTGPLARNLWVWFEPDMIPGYAWSFPLAGGRVNVGYGVLRGSDRAGGHLRGQRIDWTERPHIAEVLGPDAAPEGPWRAWPIPTRIGQASLSALGGRVLFAGDAAGACDPMTGEGIAQAFETGEVAARSLVQAGPGEPGAAARRYERNIRWGMALDDRLAVGLSAVLGRSTGADRALAIVDSSEWSRRNFARWMFEDYPRAALVTPHRWRRRMFSSPGAFVKAASRPATPSRVGPERPSTATFAGHD
jgi:geranylgeranyl reductase family protein